MLIALLIVFLIAAVAAVYLLLLRPILRRLAVLKTFWANADALELSFWKKIQQLFDGLKIKLLARLMWVPTAIVALYDRVLPNVTGIDVTPLMQMLPQGAATALPIVGAILVPVLIDWARSYSSSPQPPGA